MGDYVRGLQIVVSSYYLARRGDPHYQLGMVAAGGRDDSSLLARSTNAQTSGCALVLFRDMFSEPCLYLLGPFLIPHHITE